ncbi:MAG: polysaccharide deacetylase family protein [Alphaproteobacteria bacterium]|nr:polysaccharide deacetylase family protein [Alphaproteobacteria bacterium]
MRKILIAAVALLGLLLPATAGAPRPKAELALFQSHNIFKSGLPRAHTIALTFDDGPNTHTAEVLDVLKQYGVKATFFIVGKEAHRHPQTLARIAAEGHLLANHSADHELLGARYDASPERLLNELRDVDEQIRPLMKHGDKLYFRAPYGSWKSAHADILNADRRLRDYVGPIYWDIGGDISMRDGYVMSAADWDCWHIHWKAQTCAKGYLREIRRKDGGVVLMHCIHLNSAALVRAVVPALLEEGYTFVRLDQMPEYRQYETPGTEMGIASAGDLLKLAGFTVK